MTLLPASLSFPGQTPGTSSAPMSITLYNDGISAVNMTNVAISPLGVLLLKPTTVRRH